MNQQPKPIYIICPGCHPTAQFSGKVIAELCSKHKADLEDWQAEMKRKD